MDPSELGSGPPPSPPSPSPSPSSAPDVAAARRTRTWTAMDAALLTTATLWGVNYSVIKVVLRKMPPLAFSGVRMAIATTVFLIAILVSRWLRHRARGLHGHVVRLTPGGQDSLAIFRTAPLTAEDWRLLALLGLIGHAAYQALFIEGVARTSVANASLIIACTPIFVALATAALGQERLGLPHWIGTALSLTGVYLVVGAGARVGQGHAGDLLVLGSAWCWATYTMLGRVLLRRHSPLTVTGYSLAVGTALFLPYSASSLARTPWRALDAGDWGGLAFSALLALNVGYVLWYAGVQRLGSARTAVYSNLVPITALIVAVVWLGETLAWVKVVGTAAVIAGLALTRLRVPTQVRVLSR